MGVRKLAAILYSDIHGFQKLLNENERAAIELVHRYKAILTVAIKKHKGHVVKVFGDAHLITFASAGSAVECAADAQKLFEDYNTNKKPAIKISARIGVDIGEVLLEEENVYGKCVNVAMKLCQSVSPGGICISEAVHGIIKGKITHSFSYIGTRSLDGDEDPIGIYQDAGGIPPEAAAAVEAGTLKLIPAQEPAPENRAENVRAPDPLGDFSKSAEGKRTRTHKKLPKFPRKQTEPITRAILSIDHRNLMFEVIGGLRVLERQLFTLERAGIREVWLSTHPLTENAVAALRWPKRIKVYWTGKSEETEDLEAEVDCEPPYASVSGDHFIRLRSLENIFSSQHGQPTSYQDGSHRGVVQIALEPSFQLIGFDKKSMPRGSFFRLSYGMDITRAVRWLLTEARKETDSFMARNFDRKISLAVTRQLLKTNVTPNQVTVFSSAVGAAGALTLAGGTHLFLLAGALTIWAHTLFDGCDGELARIKFAESRYGGQLDFWGDNVVHFLLFSCLGIGQWRVSGEALPLILGLIAAASSLLAALLVYRYSVERVAGDSDGPLFRGIEGMTQGGRWTRWLESVEHTLSQRDFIYLFLFLAVINRADIFLWASAIGTPLFLLAFIFLRSFAQKS